MKEYTLSGKTGSIWTIGSIIAIPLSIVLSLVYAYINYYNPLPYFTVMAWVMYLALIITVIKIATKGAKCRNTTSVSLFGLMIGILSLHLSWATFCYVFANANPELGMSIELTDVLFNPFIGLVASATLAETGWYSIFGYTPTGIIAWLIFLIEGGGLVFAGFTGGLSVLHEEIFCEDCNQWTTDLNYDMRITIPEQSTLEAALNGDVETLLTCSETPKETSHHLRLNLHQCESCKNLATLDFDLIKVSLNDKNELEEDAKDLSKVFILSTDLFTKFINKEFSST